MTCLMTLTLLPRSGFLLDCLTLLASLSVFLMGVVTWPLFKPIAMFFWVTFTIGVKLIIKYWIFDVYNLYQKIYSIIHSGKSFSFHLLKFFLVIWQSTLYLWADQTSHWSLSFQLFLLLIFKILIIILWAALWTVASLLYMWAIR